MLDISKTPAVITSYHNHTNWSDGIPTIAEQLTEAARIGLDEVGISDHYVLTPDRGPVEWSMPLERMAEYVQALQFEADLRAGTIVRIGLEADFFPETSQDLKELIGRYPFDFIIGSVHFVDSFPIDSTAEDWEPLSQDKVDEYWTLYWRRIAQMAQSGVYDFAAHLDLPKKFGFRPRADMTKESNDALDAIAAAGMAIEINTAGWEKPAAEAYPTLDLLKSARAREIPLLINSDAHETAHLIRHFDRARDLARQAGYSELVRYERRNRFPVPL